MAEYCGNCSAFEAENSQWLAGFDGWSGAGAAAEFVTWWHQAGHPDEWDARVVVGFADGHSEPLDVRMGTSIVGGVDVRATDIVRTVLASLAAAHGRPTYVANGVDRG